MKVPQSVYKPNILQDKGRLWRGKENANTQECNFKLETKGRERKKTCLWVPGARNNKRMSTRAANYAPHMLNARWKPTTPQGLKGRRHLERRQWSQNNRGSAWKRKRGWKEMFRFHETWYGRWKDTIPIATPRVARHTSRRNSTITASCRYRGWKTTE